MRFQSPRFCKNIAFQPSASVPRALTARSFQSNCDSIPSVRALKLHDRRSDTTSKVSCVIVLFLMVVMTPRQRKPSCFVVGIPSSLRQKGRFSKIARSQRRVFCQNAMMTRVFDDVALGRTRTLHHCVPLVTHVAAHGSEQSVGQNEGAAC